MQEAIILVGGKGTRLRPLTNHTPKPLLNVAGSSFIRHQIAKLMDAGVEHVVFATSYLAGLFEEEFRDFAQGLEISYAVEEVPLGTGGAIRNAGRLLRGDSADAPVLVLNGDILSGVDLRAVLERHEAREADVTLHLTRVPDPRAFGLVPTDATGRVLSFLEKPKTAEECVTDQINAGCYVFRRSVLDAIPADRVVSVEQETFPQLVAEGRPVLGHTTDDYWRDLGTPLAFVHGSADLVTGKVTSPLVERHTEALIHPTATVAPTARVTGGSTIGPGAVIGPHVVVDRSIIGGGVTVAEGTRIHESVVDHDSSIGRESFLREVVVGCHAHIGAENELPAQLRLSCGIRIPAQGVRVSGTAAACLTAH
ncbi:mannose-1-phosphate guanylyltransferase [Streptomyces sp. 3213]|uniref:nucleotidyltransferase family protein n=1 Tax=Streptomyces sp. 3213.3 TaxID=1855348 RepID=UPI0008965540|nr:NDP-sugar synthase [Streptomyces sp. 3213.3]SED74505.1 mannose-1-phosphate guanylyltransferase [Streptomyces sp. 3213] [Streptomyces sp. 3213.3]